jgi:hypothetical protein
VDEISNNEFKRMMKMLSKLKEIRKIKVNS